MPNNNGGRINELQVQAFTTETAISYAGTLLKKGSAVGKVDICGAGEVPLGFAFGTTKNPITKIAEANVLVSVQALIEGQTVGIPLATGNAEIAAWDEVETAASGGVDRKSGPGEIVGYALEAATAATGAAGVFLLVRIARRTALA
jgi:hypothetical protein